MTRHSRRSVLLAIVLSNLAGYVDANGFLSVGNFFVSFMSGNTTRMGIAISEGRWHYALLSLAVIGLFVSGVALGSVVGHLGAGARKPWVLTLVGLLLACAELCYLGHVPHGSTVASVVAMGALNATFEREGEVSIGLTYMTGTLVKFGQRLASYLLTRQFTGSFRYLSLWIGLLSGAVLGSYMHERIGIAALWLPALESLALAFFLSRFGAWAAQAAEASG